MRSKTAAEESGSGAMKVTRRWSRTSFLLLGCRAWAAAWEFKVIFAHAAILIILVGRRKTGLYIPILSYNCPCEAFVTLKQVLELTRHNSSPESLFAFPLHD